MPLGLADQVQFEIPEKRVVALEEGEIEGDALAHRRVGEVLSDALPVSRIGNPLAEGREVVLLGRHLDVGEELSALADQVKAAPEKVTGGPHPGRVGVGLRQHATAKEGGDLEGVDPIVLGLPPVDGLHEEGVTEDEGDLFPGTEIGQPVPSVDALDADDEAIPIGSDHLQERAGVGGEVLVDQDLPVGVQDAGVDGSGVQVDSAPMAVLTVVESHGFSSYVDGTGLVATSSLRRTEQLQEGAQ